MCTTKPLLPLLLLAAALIPMAGCTPPDAPQGAPAVQPHGESPIAAAPGDRPDPHGTLPPGSPEAPVTRPGAIDLRPVDKAGYDAILASHRGKVIVVDFWATWCEPCKELFPHTVDISRKFDPAHVAVISMAFDDATAIPEAQRFLASQGATFQHLLSITPIDDGVEEYDIDGGAIPHIKVYDQQGQVHRAFSGGPDGPLDPVQVEQAIKELLARSGE